MSTRGRPIVAAIVFLLAAGVAMRGLGGLLAGMHAGGADSHTISALVRLFHWGPDLKQSAGVIDGWQSYRTSEALGVANAWDVVQWFLAIDSFFFAPAYAVLIFVLLGFAVADYRIARVGRVAIVLALIFDELENLSYLATVWIGWDNGDTHGFHTALWALWLASWLKWIAAGTAVAIAVLCALILGGRPQGGWRRLWAGSHVVRLQVVLVGFAAVLLFAHEQIPDVVRRWTPLTLALAVGFMAVFAELVFLTTRRLLVIGPLKRSWTPETAWRAEWRIAAGLFALAAVQFVIHLFSKGAYDPGWGLMVPAMLLVLLAIAGFGVPESAPAAVEEPSADRLKEKRMLPRLLTAVVVGSFGLGVLDASFGYAVYRHELYWQALLLPGGALVGLVVRLLLVRRWEPLFWAAGGAGAGLAVLAAFDSRELHPTVLVMAALLLLLAAWRAFDAMENAPQPKRMVSYDWAGVAVLGVAAVTAWMIASPWWLASKLGVVGVLYLFLCGAILVASGIEWVAPAVPAPRVLRAFRRKVNVFPILAVLGIWVVVASNLDPGGYHDARVKNTSVAAKGVTLQETFACWLRKNGLPLDKGQLCTQAPGPVTASTAKATPLVLVASTGGGIRAAYWTSLVLDCAFDRVKPQIPVPARYCANAKPVEGFRRSNHLFALSGISGGSLGMAAYAAHLTNKRAHGTEAGWPRRSLRVDALSPSGAWWLFVELPRAFLQFDVPRDRAAVLEKGWERKWKGGELGQGILDISHNHSEVPLLLLNGTSVSDGCRFEASALDGNVERLPEDDAGTDPGTARAKAKFVGCKSTDPFDDTLGPTAEPAPLDQSRVAPESVLPGTKDLVDYLCNEKVDVRLSTAALLSARFPFVNPSGRVERRCSNKDFKKPVAYVVDGGYLDTSGASPIVELMQSLGPMIDRWNGSHPGRCIVPTMVQIDNGFNTGAAHSSRPKELLVPSTTLGSARGGREAEARAGAALLFAAGGAPGQKLVNRWAHYVNQVHAGPHSPLGWVQSNFSESELDSQLDKPQNLQALGEVQRWLQPDGLTCG